MPRSTDKAASDSNASNEQLLEACQAAVEHLGVSRPLFYERLYGKTARDGDSLIDKSGASDLISQITDHKDEVVDQAFNPTATSLGVDEKQFEQRLRN